MTLALLLALAACSPAPVPPLPAPPAPAPAPVADHEATPHSHNAAHGGVVRTVGDLHVEALMMPVGVMFYLSDAAQKPLGVDGYTGSAVVQGSAGVTTVTLMPMGDHLHAAVALEQGKPASVVLTLTHAGAAASAQFQTATVGMQSHDHTALHGGQVSMWGDLHLEYAPADGQYRVWVTDEHRNPVPGPVSGAVHDGDRTIPLVAGDGALLSAAGEGAGSRPVTVDVTASGKTFSLGFQPKP